MTQRRIGLRPFALQIGKMRQVAHAYGEFDEVNHPGQELIRTTTDSAVRTLGVKATNLILSSGEA